MTACRFCLRELKPGPSPVPVWRAMYCDAHCMTDDMTGVQDRRPFREREQEAHDAVIEEINAQRERLGV